MSLNWTLAALLVILQTVCANPVASKSTTEFIILHNNDMHARFEEANAIGGPCNKDDAAAHKCFGGFARIAHEVRKYRAAAQNGSTPVLYLNAGDTYSGTSWFAVFKHNITSAFLNKLQPDAMCLGNHEFEENVSGLIPFLNAAEFPILASNLDLSQEPELAATNRIQNSTVLELNGTKIGVIGYLTPKTKEDFESQVEFLDEIAPINNEAEKLKSQGINIIIALGHSGYKRDQQIARDCPHVDIVVGAHSHTYLDSSQPVADEDDADPEAVRGPYPTIVQQSSGKRVPILQAFANTKYLGKLHVQFDAEGKLIECNGAPILLNGSIPQEQDFLDLLDVYRQNITAKSEQIVGYTHVYLEGGRVCRRKECNLGNLIADSMVNTRVKEYKGGNYWTDAALAFISGGGIRTSIEKNANGSISYRDIEDTIPYNNLLYITRISGKTLLEALEHSASVKNTDSDGAFLQLSGIRVVYDFEREKGSRVISALVRCAECYVPAYSQLNETELYKVIVPSFLLNGGDGYSLLEKVDPFSELLQKNDKAALLEYLADKSFVYPEIDGRITIRKNTN